MKKISSFTVVVAICLIVLLNAVSAHAADWSFAVVCDSRSSYSNDPALPGPDGVVPSGPLTSQFYDAAYGISPFFKNVAAALAREKGIDFVLYPGDLVRGKKPVPSDLQMATDLQQWLIQMNSGTPFYYIRGNHDAYAAGATAVSTWTSNIPVPNVSGNPVNQDAAQLGLTYSFTHKGSLFVGLDEYPNGTGATGYDSAFLNAELAKQAQHKFVFAHQPIWNFKASELGPAGLATDMNNGGVDLYFSGHVHSYQRIKENGYNFQEMIIGTGGAPQDNPTLDSTGTGYVADPNLTVMSYAGGSSTNAKFGYAIITVHDDGSITTKMMFLDNPYDTNSTVSVFDNAQVKAPAGPWKFGVMGDTQFTTTDVAGTNPNGVSVTIINQINQEFINKGVRFVVQVGDLTENGNDADEAVRANAAQPLMNAGIGFFPMRGNHETYANPVNNYAIPKLQSLYPQTRCLSNTFGAGNCNSPIAVSSDLNGMSYSIDYNNVRFVILDTWATPSKVDNNADGYAYGYTVNDQQPWISGRLDKTARGTDHAFVFSHQPLIAENHQDTMFSGYTNANTDWQNAFYASLQNNNVKYFMSGHDHIHQRSVVASPDGLSTVQELIAASNSSKYYTPKSLTDSKWYGQKTRETSLSQDMYTVGYYIYTVDGPRVTVEYWSDDHGNWLSDASYPSGPTNAGTHITPTYNFIKKETWGYSLNGKEVLVAQGGSYVLTDDTTKAVANGETGYLGTTAMILNGTNGSTKKDYTNRSLTKNVDTGWAPIQTGLASDIFTLWGMTDAGAAATDTFALSMHYDSSKVPSGLFGLAVKDSGSWVKATNKNVGGTPTFVNGPYNAAYALGTYGIDSVTNTAWAVINHNSDYAVAPLSVSDVSSQVSVVSTAIVYSRATKLYTGKLTITNTSASPITGPVAVALNGLTSGVTLANSLGQYNGAPYTTVSNSGLAASASITVPVQFSNPSNAKINFTPVTIQE